eukprot:gene32173-16708_t
MEVQLTADLEDVKEALTLLSEGTARNPFERGAKDVFTFEDINIGELTQVVVVATSTRMGDGWHLDYVSVKNTKTGDEAKFSHKNWCNQKMGWIHTLFRDGKESVASSRAMRSASSSASAAGAMAGLAALTAANPRLGPASSLSSSVSITDTTKPAVGSFSKASPAAAPPMLVGAAIASPKPGSGNLAAAFTAATTARTAPTASTTPAAAPTSTAPPSTVQAVKTATAPDAAPSKATKAPAVDKVATAVSAVSAGAPAPVVSPTATAASAPAVVHKSGAATISAAHAPNTPVELSHTTSVELPLPPPQVNVELALPPRVPRSSADVPELIPSASSPRAPATKNMSDAGDSIRSTTSATSAASLTERTKSLTKSFTKGLKKSMKRLGSMVGSTSTSKTPSLAGDAPGAQGPPMVRSSTSGVSVTSSTGGETTAPGTKKKKNMLE